MSAPASTTGDLDTRGGSDNRGATSVFTDSTLVRRIAEFQRGYPHAVAAMVRSATNAQLAHVRGQPYGFPKRVEGALPRLAVAMGDVHALKLLFNLKTRPQYRNDPLLKFVNLHRLAVQLKQGVVVLETLAELMQQDPAWRWEPHLLSHAMSTPDGDSNVLEVLEWLYQHLPHEMRVLRPQDMFGFARKGNLEVIRWLLDRGCAVPWSIADSAALSRNADLVAYFYAHSDARCSPHGVINAARSGDVEIMKIVAAGQTDATYERAINAAARFGQLDVVRYFVESGIGVGSKNVIDEAVGGRHLNIVQYLHEHLPRRSTPPSPTDAPARERLDNGTEFLQRQTGLTGCTASALERAVVLRQTEIVEFLCTHRSEGDISAAMVSAASLGDLKMVTLLHKHLRAHDSAYPAVKAAARVPRNEVVRFLCMKQELTPETPTFLTRALAEEEDWLLRVLSSFSTMAELLEARDTAIEQKRSPQRIQILERWIRSLTRDTARKRR